MFATFIMLLGIAILGYCSCVAVETAVPNREFRLLLIIGGVLCAAALLEIFL